MSEERYKLIKENVYTRCHIAEYTGIGLSCPDKEEIELIDYVEELKSQLQQKENIIKEVREYIESHKKMTQGTFNGKEWVEQYFELVCNPKELLEILDKES